LGALRVLVAKMPKYVFLFQNGIPADQIVELQDDSTAVEEWTRLRMFSDKQAGHIKEQAVLRSGGLDRRLRFRRQRGGHLKRLD
jgi:hypothetical protein